MTEIQKHIDYFNNLHGQKVNKAMLEAFYNRIAKEPQLKVVKERVLKVIRKIGNKTVKIDLSTKAKVAPAPVKRKKKNIADPIAKKVTVAKKAVAPIKKIKASKPKPIRKTMPAMVPPKKVVPIKKDGVLSGHDIANMQFKELHLDGMYARDFIRLFMDTLILIWGKPGAGKTVYLLLFAQYLAQAKNLKVIYVAAEEQGRSTFTEKCRDFNIHHPNLKFVKNFAQLEKEGLSLQDFDVIFLDSVQKLKMNLDRFIEFYEAHPGKMIVAVIQSTKDGDFRGGKDWEHEVDFAGEIVKDDETGQRYLRVQKNRLQKGSTVQAAQPPIENAYPYQQQNF